MGTKREGFDGGRTRGMESRKDRNREGRGMFEEKEGIAMMSKM
jgi:hypothetical protein